MRIFFTFLFVNHYNCSASFLSLKTLKSWFYKFCSVLAACPCSCGGFSPLHCFAVSTCGTCAWGWVALSLSAVLSEFLCHIRLVKKFLKSELNTVWMAQLKQRQHSSACAALDMITVPGICSAVFFIAAANWRVAAYIHHSFCSCTFQCLLNSCYTKCFCSFNSDTALPVYKEDLVCLIDCRSLHLNCSRWLPFTVRRELGSPLCNIKNRMDLTVIRGLWRGWFGWGHLFHLLKIIYSNPCRGLAVPHPLRLPRAPHPRPWAPPGMRHPLLWAVPGPHHQCEEFWLQHLYVGVVVEINISLFCRLYKPWASSVIYF